jgi:hypothetical protein
MAYRFLALFTGLVLSASAMFATGTPPAVMAAPASGASVKMTTLQPTSAITQNIASMPVESAAQVRSSASRTMPLLGVPNKSGLQAPALGAAIQLVNPMLTPFANGTGTGFDGMADSATICPYFGGCQPPDMALATSNSYVFQGVNTSFETWTTKGAVVAGPTSAQSFFGIPDPAPSGCDPNGPFLSDPRAFYDPNDGLFWAAVLQVENNLGIAPACNTLSLLWVANYNPATGVIHSYSFDTSLGFPEGNDYTQFGFNSTTVAVGANMFNSVTGNYDYAETLFLNKQAMEQGQAVTPVVAYDYTANGVVLDTVQPAETPTLPSKDPGVLYLVNSYNINGDPQGDNCLYDIQPCKGFTVWAYDPSTQTITGSLVSDTSGYIDPVNADEPICSDCIETIDNRITGTPVYSVDGNLGLLSLALETMVFNGTTVVPAVRWGQLQPSLSGHTLTGASVYQEGTVSFAGDQAASFGAVSEDNHSNLVMVFDTMSSTLNPSIMVAKRQKQDPLGTLEAPVMVKRGDAPTLDSRWGDFEATSYTGSGSNNIWVASQYSGSNLDWHTFIYQAQ